MINIKQKVGLHNEFRLERRKAIFHEDGSWSVGELIQEAFGYNLILNQGIVKIMNGLRTGSTVDHARNRITRNGSEDTTARNQTFGGRIHVGNGTGTLASTRTALFGFLASYMSSFDSREIGTDWCSYTQVYTIQPNELVGQNITEVGLASHSASAYLSTHALLQDSEGNPISILNKKDTEVVVVYAKLYVQLDADYGSNFFWGVGVKNSLLRIFYNNGIAYEGRIPISSLAFGDNNSKPSPYVAGKSSTLAILGNTLLNIQYPATTQNNSLFFIKLARRLGTAEGNGKIWEIATNMQIFGEEFSGGFNFDPQFRAVMPVAGVYEGHTFTDAIIGTGNGSQTVFTSVWNDWNANAVTVKVDDVVVSSGITINRTNGTITFGTAPSNGAVVKVTYSVNYIPKDVGHVLDIGFEFHFSDANAV